MEAVTELIGYIIRFKGRLKGFGAKADALIDGIARGTIRTEAEAERRLYGTRGTQTFRVFKHSIQHSLIDHASSLEDSRRNVSAHRKALGCCYRYIRLARLLIAVGARNGADATLKKAYTVGLKYGITDVVVTALWLLRHQAFLNRDRGQYEKLDNELSLRRRILQTEHEIRGIFEKTVLYYGDQAAHLQDALNFAQSHIDQVQAVSNYYQTRDLMICSFALQRTIAEMKGDHQELVAVITQEMDWYKQNKHLAPASRLAVLELEKATAYYMSNENTEGLAAAQRAFERFPLGRLNWHTAAERVFLCAMRCGAYRQAASALTAVARYKHRQSALSRETWLMFEAALRLVEPASLPANVTIVPGTREWNAARFEAALPTIRADREGNNITRSVLSAAISLREFAEYGEAEAMDRFSGAVASLQRRYGGRLNRQRPSYRLRCLIRFYGAVVKNDFALDAARGEAQRWLEKMEGAPQRPNLNTMEALPYEEHIRQALKAIETIEAKALVALPFGRQNKKAA